MPVIFVPAGVEYELMGCWMRISRGVPAGIVSAERAAAEAKRVRQQDAMR
jgi:hypothetical protein